jgi:hypothetical protein
MMDVLGQPKDGDEWTALPAAKRTDGRRWWRTCLPHHEGAGPPRRTRPADPFKVWLTHRGNARGMSSQVRKQGDVEGPPGILDAAESSFFRTALTWVPWAKRSLPMLVYARTTPDSKTLGFVFDPTGPELLDSVIPSTQAARLRTLPEPPRPLKIATGDLWHFPYIGVPATCYLFCSRPGSGLKERETEGKRVFGLKSNPSPRRKT